MKKRYRIKSKFRFYLFLTITFLAIIITVGTIAGYNQALSMSNPAYEEITTITGDTLWKLAKEYGPADQDVRKVVHAICRINDTSADELKAGQKILIPKFL